jgi:tetratricopeptide (TPR) repeat protein
MARKRLNKNLVVALTFCLFGAMLALSVVMLTQLRRRDPQYFVERAEQSAQRAEWKSAALFYRKAWERSDDATHLVAQCDVLLHSGELNLALAALGAALVNQPDFTPAHIRQLELRLEIANLYRKLEDWQRVFEGAETFLASAAKRTPAQEAMAHNAKGMALIALAGRDESNAEQGESALRRAVELAPGFVAFTIDLAEYLVRVDRSEEGKGLFVDLIERHAQPGEDAVHVRARYGGWLAKTLQLDDAERYFKDAIARAGNQVAAVLEAKLGYGTLLALQWVRARDADEPGAQVEALFDRAEDMLRACIDLDPEGFDAYLQLVRLYGSARRHRDIVEVCELRLTRGFSREGVAGRRNQLETFNLMIQASTACTHEAVTAQKEGDQETRQQWLTRAEQYLADARGEFASHPRVLSQSGQLKLARGLDREALEDLRAADEAYRSYDTIDWDSKRLLAQLHLRLNEAGAAKIVMEDVLQVARRTRRNDVSFWTLYAQVLFATNEFQRALAMTDRVLASVPDHADALRLKAAIYERQGRHGDAGRIVEAISGDKAVRAMLTAQQHVIEGDVEQTIAVLLEALEEAPGDARLVGAALRSLTDQGRWEEAQSIVTRALQSKPGDLKLRRLQILARQDLSIEKRADAILELIESEEDAFQRSLDLVGFHGRQGDFDTALKWIDEALRHLVAQDTPIARNSTPGQHRALLMAKLRLGARLDNASAMASARNESVQFNVDGAAGRSMVGLYFMYTQEFDRAIRNLEEAIELQPTDVQSLVALGQCWQAIGRADEARDAFQEAVRVHPNSGMAHRGLASLALLRGDRTTYATELKICERLIPSDPWVVARRLEEQEESDPSAAITRREALLDGQDDHTENLKRLVTLCESVDDLTKADRYMTRLLEENPGERDVVVMAGQYYRRTARPDQSLTITRNYIATRSTLEEKANAHILLASHFLGTDELDRVESTLLEALKIASTFDLSHSLAEFYLRRQEQPRHALPWYDKAIDHARSSSANRVVEMMERRIECLMHRKMNDLESAWAGIQALRDAYPEHARAWLLESELHARNGQIDAAITSLSDYLVHRPGDAAAFYRRALFHNAQGNVQSALDDLRAAKRLDPLGSDLRPRLLLARLYQQTGQGDQRVHELEALVSDMPDSTDALEALSYAYIDSGRSADAERIVTAQINQSAQQPDARWFFLRGRVSIELGDRHRALVDFQRGAELEDFSPQSVVKVLELFAQLDRPADGIGYFSQHVDADRLTAQLAARHALLLAKMGSDSEAVAKFREAMNLALIEGAMARADVAQSLTAAFPPVAPAFDAVNQAIKRFDGQPVANDSVRSNDRILVHLFRSAQRNGEAVDRLWALVKASPNDQTRVGLLFELGELYQSTGDSAAARGAYERGLALEPDNWKALNNLAYLLSDELGEYESARSLAERAVTLEANAVTLDTLGWIKVGLRDYTSAVADLSRAVSLSSNDPLAFYHLGEAYRRNGQFVAADEVLQRGLSLARDDSDIAARIQESRDRAARTEQDE